MTTTTNIIKGSDRNVPVSISPAAAECLLRRTDDREFVMSFLHHAGPFKSIFTADEQFQIRLLADGFGKTADHDLVWDWSHVRDSSDEAMSAMATAIRTWIHAHTR